MKKLLFVGAVGVAVFAFVAIAKAQDVGFEGVFDSSVSVDLKVNGQDGPVTVEKGSRIVVSWLSQDASRCRGNWSKNDIKLSGTVAGKISKSALIKVACINEDRERADDVVGVNIVGLLPVVQPGQPKPTIPTSAQPSITVLSPNGGESITAGQSYRVTWRSIGMASDGIARIFLNRYHGGTVEVLLAELTTPGNCQGNSIPNIPCVAIEQGWADVRIPTSTPPHNNYYSIEMGCYRYSGDGNNLCASGGAGDESDAPFTITASVPTTSGKPLISGCGSLGDVNNDGVISSTDTDKMSAHILGTATLTADEQTRADVNKSDSTTTLDKALINGYILGTQTTFPGCTATTTSSTVNQLAGAGIPESDVWGFVKAFFGGR